MWPGRTVDNKMTTLIGGFSDGVLRIMSIDHAEQVLQLQNLIDQLINQLINYLIPQ